MSQQNKRILIGITGKIGAGKTISAKILEHAHNFQEYTMAGPLKSIALALGFTYKEVNGTQEEKLVKNKYWDISGREFLQKFGTDICRDILPNVINMNLNNRTLWCRVFENYYNENKNLFPYMVVSDCRFKDELDLIKELGGVTVKIVRVTGKPADNSEKPANNDTIAANTNNTANAHLTHISETLQYKTNFVIYNGAGLYQLIMKLAEMIKLINGGYHKITNSTIYI